MQIWRSLIAYMFAWMRLKAHSSRDGEKFKNQLKQ